MKSYKRFYRTYKEFVMFTLSVVVFAGVFMWGVVPGLSKVKDVWTETDALKKDVQVLNRKIQILDAMDADQLKDAAQALQLAVPVAKDLPGVMTAVETLTGQYGLNLDSLTLTGATLSSDSARVSQSFDKKLGVGVAPFKFTVQGQVASIRDLLATFIQVRRLMNVQTIDLSLNSQNASSSGLVRSNITAQAFFLPPPTTIGKVGDSIEALSASEQKMITDISSFPIVSSIPELTSSAEVPATSANKANPFIP